MLPVEYQEFLEALSDGLVVVDSSLKVRFANRAFLDICALTEDRAGGRDIGDIIGGGRSATDLRRGLEDLIANDSIVGPVEVEMQFPTVGRRVLRVVARKIRPSGGDAPIVLVTFQDVTAVADLRRENERQQRLLQGIVDTVREPVLVLDGRLVVIAASRSFYRTFRVTEADTRGRLLHELGDGQWDIPVLRDLLENVVPARTAVEDFEVEHPFPGLGRRIMLLNARTIYREGNNSKTFLLAIEDITERRRLEEERAAATRRVELLLEELNHRVMNSLSIISSVIGIEGRAMTDEAARAAFDRISGRVMAVATLYKTLSVAKSVDSVDAPAFLGGICHDVVHALQRESAALRLTVEIDPFAMSSSVAISAGLVLNELLTNAIKYAFRGRQHGEVTVAARLSDGQLSLSVTDNGSGIDADARVDSGIGGRLIELFSRQLGGETVRTSGSTGTQARLTFPLAQPSPK